MHTPDSFFLPTCTTHCNSITSPISLYHSIVTIGGPITWKTDQVKFRHMNTGMYLHQKLVDMEDSSGNPLRDYVFTIIKDDNEKGTLFSVNELNSTRKYLQNGKALQISQNGIWVERGDLLGELSNNTFEVRGTRERQNAVSLIAARLNESKLVRKSDVAVEETEDVPEEGESVGRPPPYAYSTLITPPMPPI